MSDEIINNDEAFDETLAAVIDFTQMRTAEINQLNTNTTEALTNLSSLANRVYGYEHEDFTVKSLETVYDEIINASPAINGLSAVGFTAVLKPGDGLFKQNNRLFINGTEEENDYTFEGTDAAGKYQIVNVWYFENNDSLTLNSAVDLLITKFIVKNKMAVPGIHSSYYEFVNEIVLDNYTLSSPPLSCKKFTELGRFDRASTTVPANLREYTSDVVQMKRQFTGLNTKTTIEKINLPEVVYIGVNNVNNPAGSENAITANAFYNTSNPNLTISFPKLEYAVGGRIGQWAQLFYGVSNVELPESVKALYFEIFDANKSVKLYCKDAEYIAEAFFRSAPTELFYMCPDWGASVNIAVAASRWVKSDFIDLFTNKLRDMGNDVRELKIPSAIYDELTDEEFEIAEDKGWTVGC